jgi:hypothetical protein
VLKLFPEKRCFVECFGSSSSVPVRNISRKGAKKGRKDARKNMNVFLRLYGFGLRLCVKQNLDFFISPALVIVSPKEICMAKKRGEYLANDPDYVPDPEIEEFMELEISRAPKDPELLAHRLRNNTAASPRDAGGDLDADWEDVNASGIGNRSGRQSDAGPIARRGECVSDGRQL